MPAIFWRILEQCFPNNVKDSVKGMRMSKDSKGVVFDLPSNLSSVVKVRLTLGRFKDDAIHSLNT